MGVVYYGRYFEYFEVGRTELLREIGLRYLDLENEGIALPVTEAHCRYKAAARYDQVITVRSTLSELPTTAVRINYDIYDEHGKKLVEGYSVHMFVRKTGQIMRPPASFVSKLKPYF